MENEQTLNEFVEGLDGGTFKRYLGYSPVIGDFEMIEVRGIMQ